MAILEGAGFSAPPPSADRTLAAPGLLVRPTKDTADAAWTLGHVDLRDEASWTPVAIASNAL